MSTEKIMRTQEIGITGPMAPKAALDVILKNEKLAPRFEGLNVVGAVVKTKESGRMSIELLLTSEKTDKNDIIIATGLGEKLGKDGKWKSAEEDLNPKAAPLTAEDVVKIIGDVVKSKK